MAQTTHQPEIYMFAKRERIILQRLRELGAVVYDTLVRRLVAGDSIRATAKYLHHIKPQIGERNANLWLAVLAKEVGQHTQRNRIDEQTQKEINAFNEAMANARRRAGLPEQLTARPEPPPPLEPGAPAKFNVHIVQAILDRTAEEKLNYAYAMQMERVDRMMEQEKRLGLIFPMGYRNLDTLRAIAADLLKKEALRGFFNNQPAQERNITPFAKVVSEFDEVDRNLIQQGAAKIVQMLEEEHSGQYTRSASAQGVGDVARGETGTPQDGALGNNAADVPEGP